jgi:hypothetical protein
MLTFTDDTGSRELGTAEVEEIRKVLPFFEGIFDADGYKEIFFTEDTGEGGFEIIFKVFDGRIEVTKFL